MNTNQTFIKNFFKKYYNCESLRENHQFVFAPRLPYTFVSKLFNLAEKTPNKEMFLARVINSKTMKTTNGTIVVLDYMIIFDKVENLRQIAKIPLTSMVNLKNKEIYSISVTIESKHEEWDNGYIYDYVDVNYSKVEPMSLIDVYTMHSNSHTILLSENDLDFFAPEKREKYLDVIFVVSDEVEENHVEQYFVLVERNGKEEICFSCLTDAMHFLQKQL